MPRRFIGPCPPSLPCQQAGTFAGMSSQDVSAFANFRCVNSSAHTLTKRIRRAIYTSLRKRPTQNRSNPSQFVPGNVARHFFMCNFLDQRTDVVSVPS